MFEVTITEIKKVAERPADDGSHFISGDQRIDRLKMTIDGELDIPAVIKSITGTKRKRNAKKAA